MERDEFGIEDVREQMNMEVIVIDKIIGNYYHPTWREILDLIDLNLIARG